MHALELVAVSELDFRDLPLLALLCSSMREAIRAGPLSLITVGTRIITQDDMDSLLHMLRWCGSAVRLLRLDQVPKSAWGIPPRGTGESATADYITAFDKILDVIAHEYIENVERVAELCPSLQVLGMSQFKWGRQRFEDDRAERLTAALARLTKLRAVHVMNQCQAVPETVSYLPVLAACSQLTQLDVALNAAMVVPVLSSPHAPNLRQISLFGLTAPVVRLLARCTALSRLHIENHPYHQHLGGPEVSNSSLQGVNLAEHLPPALTTLSIEVTMVNSFITGDTFCTTLVRRCVMLQRLSIGCEECMELSAGALDQLCTLPNLRVLDIRNAYALNDSHLAELARNCLELHTLRIDYAKGVTHRGFDALAADASQLPHLRTLAYINDVFEMNLDDMLGAKTEEELMTEEHEWLHDADWEENHVSRGDYEHYVPAFFAYARLVVRRSLAFPLQDSVGELMPWHQHRLDADYLCLGV